jgi:hypothetical protein
LDSLRKENADLNALNTDLDKSIGLAEEALRETDKALQDAENKYSTHAFKQTYTL